MTRVEFHRRARAALLRIASADQGDAAALAALLDEVAELLREATTGQA